jgi:ABC-type Mn2+/Zn2+ transport system permease subunit
MILVYTPAVALLASLPPPGDLVELPFMRTALIELALLGVAGGLLGAWIVLRRLAFFAHAVGTATFPGLVVADATGFSATVAGLAVALGYAGGVERLGRSGRVGGRDGAARGADHGDVATALALVFALALGVVLASDVFESGAAVDRLLFGTALGLGDGDLAVAAGAAALALAATLLLGRAWTAAGFDAPGASALGLPLRAADLLLLGLIAVAAVAALPAVGALLVASLFVVPAATARLLTTSVPALLAAAVAIAVAQGALGLYVSLWLDVPPGPAVAIVGSSLYACVALARAALDRAPHSVAEAA